MVHIEDQIDTSDFDERQMFNKYLVNISIGIEQELEKMAEEQDRIDGLPHTDSGIPMENITNILGVKFYDAAHYDRFWNLGDVFWPRFIQGCCSREIERGDCCSFIFMQLLTIGLFLLLGMIGAAKSPSNMSMIMNYPEL